MTHWADVIAEDLLKRGDKHRIATGITPSGHIHFGNLREIIIADAVRRAVEEKGGKAEVIYVADTFDPLRRRYPFLPEEFEKYVGMPLSEIPDPEGGCHENYAEHFLQPFLESLDVLGIDLIVKRADQMYKSGEYEKHIRIALEKRDKIAEILKEVSGREVEEDWSPFNPLCKNCGRINSAKVKSFDDKGAYYSCSCGYSGYASFREGKLTWRVDWVARWDILKITCEPFGKDHAAAGGSYDTGVRIAREVYGFEPPYPIVYEWIHLKGVGAMKSSKGIVVPVKDLVEALPPEIIRYIIIRTKPERHIEFDPSMILEVFDEFEDAYRRKDRSVQLSIVGDVVYSDVSFRHLVVVGQIANWDLEKALEILSRTYHVDETVRRDVERRLIYAKRWLEKFAPENLKFEIKEEIEVEFSEDERRFLRTFAERLEEDMSPERIHQLVYEVARELNVKPAKAFQAIYKAILGKNYGPRAGYFIKSLGIEWVKKRFKKV
ncbi:lysyl-tRNA synthetase [Ferroglobus placidus DSM 10642]|uniref:Lysine--tRNA ligase n=1 Tax=Ferroglobus placidus (strain DSM 10642 / AEDII12DO) TaxID=589924 RepID=D3S062_FERPA|nr:lysine--tRNA ligase [Ferroglobus placidus]ADC66125.1 lysyl-tRNA synthetase [Ferroglobus placidus DSM 10642]